jgi:competence transcription factor ComK
MKTNASFRLNKRFKTLISAMPFKNQEQRDSFRHMMIDAQVSASVVVKSAKDRNNNKGE